MPNRRTAQLSARHTTLVSAATLADHDGDAGWVVFDCRHDLARPEAGRSDYQSAHIPGAALREEFSALLGAHAPDAVVHQCGSGISACHNLLAMDIAGLHGGALYPGSWSEWCADPSRPILKG